jgi:hypothetical protein
VCVCVRERERVLKKRDVHALLRKLKSRPSSLELKASRKEGKK